MSESDTLQKISDDLDFLKEKVSKMEVNIEEINGDIHNKVRPRYLQKLKKIDKGRFLSEKEFEKELSA